MLEFLFDNADLLSVILTFLMGSALTMMVIPSILLIAKKKRLFDIPDERKIHQESIPRLAGVSFMPNILFSLFMIIALRELFGVGSAVTPADYALPQISFFICSMIMLYLVGIMDDLIGVRYREKFVVQIFCSIFLIMSGFWVNNLYGLFGIDEISPWIGMPFTVVLVVLVINSINLIDGIDGLASGLAMIALAVFGILFYTHGLWVYAAVAFATFGVLFSFFYYNVFGKASRGRKIFMGDTGSLTIGMILSFCAITISMDSDASVYIENGSVIAFSPLIVPVFDVIHVVFHRIRKGKHPFLPDRNHIHHKFLSMGLSPKKSLLVILSIAVFYIAMNYILIRYLNITLLIILDGILWILLLMFVNRRIAHVKS